MTADSSATDHKHWNQVNYDPVNQVYVHTCMTPGCGNVKRVPVELTGAARATMRSRRAPDNRGLV